jgi:hypothetical protein
LNGHLKCTSPQRLNARAAVDARADRRDAMRGATRYPRASPIAVADRVVVVVEPRRRSRIVARRRASSFDIGSADPVVVASIPSSRRSRRRVAYLIS